MAKESSCSLSRKEAGAARWLFQKYVRFLSDSAVEKLLLIALLDLTLAYGRYDTKLWRQDTLDGGMVNGSAHPGVAVGRSRFYKMRKELEDRSIVEVVKNNGEYTSVVVNVPGILEMLFKSPMGGDRAWLPQEFEMIRRKAVEDFRRAGLKGGCAEMSADGKITLDDMVKRGMVMSEEARARKEAKVVNLPTDKLTPKKLMVFIDVECEKQHRSHLETASPIKLSAMMKSWIKICIANGLEPKDWIAKVIRFWGHLDDVIRLPNDRDKTLQLSPVFSFTDYYHNRALIDKHMLERMTTLEEDVPVVPRNELDGYVEL